MFDVYSLPVAITCGGQVLSITNKGDYRMVLDVIEALNDEDLEPDERVEAALTIFYETEPEDIEDIAQAAQQMCDFLACGYKDEAEDNNRAKAKLMDWRDDAPMIISGVNRVLGREVRGMQYLHWWSFVSAYMEIGESTLATVIAIRDKIARGKKLQKHEQEFRREHPEYFTFKRDKARKQRDMDDIIALWGKT